MKKLKSINDLTALRERLSKEGVLARGKKMIKVCCGLPCSTLGSHKVAEALREEAEKSGIDIDIVKTGCQGLCQKGPLLQIEPHGFLYQRVHPEKAEDIISHTFTAGKPVWEFIYRDIHNYDKPKALLSEVPFYKKQQKIALRNTGNIDPFEIRHYIAVGGYHATEKMFSSMSTDDVLQEVKKSNLRGRGGAGFPAGVKWEHTRKAPGSIKIVIANGDEGDPGAFMDRSVMEGDPHSLLEGMLICAYAIRATYGFIYVRHEYPLAIKTLGIAIKQAEEMGLLGKNILGTGFDFTVQIREGAGAFVCGEATALVASIEGQRGFPHPRPPRVSEPGGGPWGYPSNLNNVETYACVPQIIEKGADWFLGIGTPGSSGTKVFSLAGKVKNTGLVEVPMGITLREIVFDIGGGIIGNKKFKAVQTGGPSGGCIPEQFLDLPVDFDSLSKVGSIMGSGGMVVMDEDNCMVDIAKFFLSFCQAESCGKCYPCRIGTYQMLQILEKITSGKGEEGDIEKLERIGQYVKKASLCGLGRSAPNPVLTTIKYFRNEYEEHVKDKYCRAFVCQGLGLVSINTDVCYQCRRCMDICPYEAIRESEEGLFYVDQVRCERCKSCFTVCPLGAIEIKEPPLLVIDKEICYFCGNCKNVCRVNAIKETSTGYMIDPEICKRCGDCYKVCPMGAIRYEKVGKVLRGSPVEPATASGGKEERTGEITVEDIRKDAETRACNVQKALRFVEEFVAGPMCGKCYPCSLGTEEAKTILVRLSQHRENAGEKDIEALRRIGLKMAEGSYCKKGRDTGKFIVDAIEASEEEFRLHLMGICPKKECVSLTEYVINPDLCITCGKCAAACKYNAISGVIKEPHNLEYAPFVIRQKDCVRCGECLNVCPTGAIEVITTIREESVTETEKELVRED